MDKKFINFKGISDYEILTDDGFKDVIALHETIPYDVYNLVLENKELKCADFHIVFLENNEEIFIKNLNIGDKIKTVDGIQEVLRIEKCDYQKEMWDFELSENNCKYYTNGILSHNTTYIRYISSLIDKRMIFVPQELAYQIASPNFLSLLMDFPNSILILEDAENIIKDRIGNDNSPVASILNISDGLLSDCLNLQMICTFNTDLGKIDKALLRKGRIITKYEFKELDVKKANKLAEKNGLESKFTKNVALAEIFNQDDDDYSPQNKSIGFYIESTPNEQQGHIDIVPPGR